MGKKYAQLDIDERSEVYRLYESRKSHGEIKHPGVAMPLLIWVRIVLPTF